MKAPGFRRAPGAYDVLKLAGLQVPGEWRIDVIDRELGSKTPKGSGQDGGHSYLTGLKSDDQFLITSLLHTDDDEAEWEKLLPIIFPLDRAGKRDRVLIYNPQIERMGIHYVFVKKVSEGRPVGGAPIPVSILCRVANQPKNAKTKALSLKNIITTTEIVVPIPGPVPFPLPLTVPTLTPTAQEKVAGVLSPSSLMRLLGR